MPDLTETVISLLSRYGHLDDLEKSPDFKVEGIATVEHSVLRDPHYTPAERWNSMYDDDSHMHNTVTISGETVYLSEFKNELKLPSLSEDDLQEMPLKDIPDSGDCILIDIGSNLGRNNTRPFARQKPNVQVIMVDQLSAEDIEDKFNYTPFPNNQSAGEELKSHVDIDKNDIEGTVNRLLKANNYPNLQYVHKILEEDDYNLGLDTKGKRVFVTGFRNPGGLGNITAKIAASCGAEKIYFNNSALEKLKPGEKRLNLMEIFLSRYLSGKEILKIANLIYDPDRTKDGRSNKYNYKNECQKCFADTLKLAFVLAQKDFLEKKGYSVEIYSSTCPHQHYNNPSHNIIASKIR